MAQYKVPQDVEADDKLLGPFTFRQFVYLLIAGGLIALAVGLFQLFPLLAIIPIPFVLLLLILALPLKKDQPMETYLAALVSYYLKPRTRRWTPGQKETTIAITAPKKQEGEKRTRDITGEEATHRLSFLANIVDTEGYAIKGAGVGDVNGVLVAEADTVSDMFETNHFNDLESTIERDENEQRAKVMQEMREAITQMEQMGTVEPKKEEKPNFESEAVVQPGMEVEIEPVEKSNEVSRPERKNETIKTKPSIIELANNPDFSIATISKEANRLKERDEGEVFVALH
ncbi:PrgI family protein [Candidatus Saccharibacteria bacterium]|nr:PrgI family protein [Candidatus Saccharibacteria bacterium]